MRISRSLFICLLIYCQVILLKQTIMSKVEAFFVYLTEEIAYRSPVQMVTLLQARLKRASDWVQESKW